MLNGLVEELTVYYDIEKDLQFLHSDKRRFTREEALKILIFKIQILNDIRLVKQFLINVLKFKGERFYFVDPEKPEETLFEFFADLKGMYFKFCIRETPTPSHKEWELAINKFLSAIHGSLFKILNGRNYLSGSDKRDDVFAQDLLKLIKPIPVQPVPEKTSQKLVMEEKLLKITEAAVRLGCSRQTVYDVHIKQGLKTVKPTGPTGKQKIKLSDLNEYMEKIKNT